MIQRIVELRPNPKVNAPLLQQLLVEAEVYVGIVSTVYGIPGNVAEGRLRSLIRSIGRRAGDHGAGTIGRQAGAVERIGGLKARPGIGIAGVVKVAAERLRKDSGRAAPVIQRALRVHVKHAKRKP